MPEQTSPAAESRLGLLDAGRVAAALAVIWMHTPEVASLLEATVLGRFAVPFFAVAAGYFSSTGRSATLPSDLARRIRRLYGLFLAWSAIYLGVRLTAAAALGTLAGFSLPPLPDLLVSGPVHHLWFLPLALLISVVAAAARLLARPRAVSACLLLGALLTLLVPRPEGIPMAYFLALTRDYLPSGLAGVALGLLVPERRHLPNLLRPFARSAALLALGCVLLEVLDQRQVWVENLLGIAVFVATVGAVPRPSRTLRALSEMTLGVYLVHVLFVEGLQDVAHAVLHVSASPALDLTVFTLSAILSFSAVHAALRWRRTQWLVR